jgi:hypothetical protein
VTAWIIAAGAVVAALGVLLAAGRAVWKWGRRVDNFFEDWAGEPGRPGVPARLGVMARLETIEDRLGAVEHELRPNSGKSLHDKVTRIHEATVEG